MSIWINVFRTGKHTDSAGKTTEFTLDTLNTIASLYNERVATQINNEAPIVKGHPKADEPAYGWIKELKVENERLYARIDEIDIEFEQEVKDKKYKNVSIALNSDLSLKHVGFLGAVPPAVKELENIQFNSEEVTINWYFSEFAELDPLEVPIPKPERYQDYTDDEFGDNLNYKFPLRTKEDVLSSIRNFGKEAVWSQYTPYEYQRIWARILSQATKFDIKQNPDIWDFLGSDEATELQTDIKPNIIKIKSQNLNISKNKIENKQMEFNQMDELTKALAEMVAWLNSTVSAEVGSQFQAQFEPIIAELGLSLQSATATATEAEATATEMSQKFNAMQKELNYLQDELTTTKIKEKLNQYDLSETQFASSLSMIKANLKNSEFSTSQAEDAVFSLIADKKKADPMTTQQFSQGNPVARTQDEAIRNIMQEKSMTYSQATKYYLGGL
jgi:hypothetical protein